MPSARNSGLSGATPDTVWVDAGSDPAAAARLSSELGISMPVAGILSGRGITDPAEAAVFLNPRLACMGDPCLLHGAREAAGLLMDAVVKRRRICVFGDYDADGLTASALMTQVLRALGGDVGTFLPVRHADGYGLTAGALERCLAECAPDLLVTVDCGISAVDVVRQAVACGVTVVVTDHHQPGGCLPPAAVCVNPKIGAPEPMADLAGVGVAFKVCHALLKMWKESGMPDGCLPDLRDHLDLVAVGTIADVAPLTGENRIMVRHGLARLNRGSRAAWTALKAVSGISGEVGVYEVGFMLAPRLNAAGRMETAEPSLEILLTDDLLAAGGLAGRLNDANDERKAAEAAILEEARLEIDAGFDAAGSFGLAVGREGWHTGTVGIVASRLVRAYNRPCAVVGLDGESGTGRGSCRSVPGLDIMRVLDICADSLDGFGGHKAAAGFALRAERFGEFKNRFNEACRECMRGLDLRRVQTIDGWIDAEAADMGLFDELAELEPFGNGNPAPVWGARGVAVADSPRVVGNGHVKFSIARGGPPLPAIWFGAAGKMPPAGRFDVAFELRDNTYCGRRSVQAQIRAIRPA